MLTRINAIVDQMEGKIIANWRDFHKYAELGWTEFRTASLVARRLHELGYEVRVGKEVIKGEDRMGVPPEAQLEKHWQRALDQGADRVYLEQLKGGYTGVVGILHRGEGPTVALRFDIDAVALTETNNPAHYPARAGFASVNEKAMHACGHDGHAAMGLGVAETLMKIKDQFRGTRKLIFQPAEEGVRAVKAMVSAGVLDDVDYLLGVHIGVKACRSGQFICGTDGFLATSKFDAYFRCTPSHGGAAPEAGDNVLLAAATAVLNLHAISRHSGGATRINVGLLTAGSGRNVRCVAALGPGEATRVFYLEGERAPAMAASSKVAISLRIFRAASTRFMARAAPVPSPSRMFK